MASANFDVWGSVRVLNPSGITVRKLWDLPTDTERFLVLDDKGRLALARLGTPILEFTITKRSNVVLAEKESLYVSTDFICIARDGGATDFYRTEDLEPLEKDDNFPNLTLFQATSIVGVGKDFSLFEIVHRKGTMHADEMPYGLDSLMPESVDLIYPDDLKNVSLLNTVGGSFVAYKDTNGGVLYIQKMSDNLKRYGEVQRFSLGDDLQSVVVTAGRNLCVVKGGGQMVKVFDGTSLFALPPGTQSTQVINPFGPQITAFGNGSIVEIDKGTKSVKSFPIGDLDLVGVLRDAAFFFDSTSASLQFSSRYLRKGALVREISDGFLAGSSAVEASKCIEFFLENGFSIKDFILDLVKLSSIFGNAESFEAAISILASAEAHINTSKLYERLLSLLEAGSANSEYTKKTYKVLLAYLSGKDDRASQDFHRRVLGNISESYRATTRRRTSRTYRRKKATKGPKDLPGILESIRKHLSEGGTSMALYQMKKRKIKFGLKELLVRFVYSDSLTTEFPENSISLLKNAGVSQAELEDMLYGLYLSTCRDSVRKTLQTLFQDSSFDFVERLLSQSIAKGPFKNKSEFYVSPSLIRFLRLLKEVKTTAVYKIIKTLKDESFVVRDNLDGPICRTLGLRCEETSGYRLIWFHNISIKDRSRLFQSRHRRDVNLLEQLEESYRAVFEYNADYFVLGDEYKHFKTDPNIWSKASLADFSKLGLLSGTILWNSYRRTLAETSNIVHCIGTWSNGDVFHFTDLWGDYRLFFEKYSKTFPDDKHGLVKDFLKTRSYPWGEFFHALDITALVPYFRNFDFEEDFGLPQVFGYLLRREYPDLFALFSEGWEQPRSFATSKPAFHISSKSSPYFGTDIERASALFDIRDSGMLDFFAAERPKIEPLLRIGNPDYLRTAVAFRYKNISDKSLAEMGPFIIKEHFRSLYNGMESIGGNWLVKLLYHKLITDEDIRPEMIPHPVVKSLFYNEESCVVEEDSLENFPGWFIHKARAAGGDPPTFRDYIAELLDVEPGESLEESFVAFIKESQDVLASLGTILTAYDKFGANSTGLKEIYEIVLYNRPVDVPESGVDLEIEGILHEVYKVSDTSTRRNLIRSFSGSVHLPTSGRVLEFLSSDEDVLLFVALDTRVDPFASGSEICDRVFEILGRGDLPEEDSVRFLRVADGVNKLLSLGLDEKIRLEWIFQSLVPAEFPENTSTQRVQFLWPSIKIELQSDSSITLNAILSFYRRLFNDGRIPNQEKRVLMKDAISIIESVSGSEDLLSEFRCKLGLASVNSEDTSRAINQLISRGRISEARYIVEDQRVVTFEYFVLSSVDEFLSRTDSGETLGLFLGERLKEMTGYSGYTAVEKSLVNLDTSLPIEEFLRKSLGEVGKVETDKIVAKLRTSEHFGISYKDLEKMRPADLLVGLGVRGVLEISDLLKRFFAHFSTDKDANAILRTLCEKFVEFEYSNPNSFLGIRMFSEYFGICKQAKADVFEVVGNYIHDEIIKSGGGKEDRIKIDMHSKGHFSFLEACDVSMSLKMMNMVEKLSEDYIKREDYQSIGRIILSLKWNESNRKLLEKLSITLIDAGFFELILGKDEEDGALLDELLRNQRILSKLSHEQMSLFYTRYKMFEKLGMDLLNAAKDAFERIRSMKWSRKKREKNMEVVVNLLNLLKDSLENFEISHSYSRILETGKFIRALLLEGWNQLENGEYTPFRILSDATIPELLDECEWSADDIKIIIEIKSRNDTERNENWATVIMKEVIVKGRHKLMDTIGPDRIGLGILRPLVKRISELQDRTQEIDENISKFVSSIMHIDQKIWLISELRLWKTEYVATLLSSDYGDYYRTFYHA